MTPIRRQYLDVKKRYPHAIVFFRLGDFYETFDADAELCARELDITLTSKPMGKGLRVPLAGIPYHAVDGYLAKLIARGYKVALCDQIGVKLQPGEREAFEAASAELKAQLGEAAYEAAFRQGRTLTAEQALALAPARP